MINGLCESPLTQWAIVRWRDALKDELVLLRDVIDLDATYGGAPDGDLQAIEDGEDPDDEQEGKGEKKDESDKEKDEKEKDEEEDDDDAENNISLSMMEETLKPQVMEVFDRVASTYQKTQRLRVKQIAAIKGGPAFSRASERRLEKLDAELVDLLKPIRLNNTSIEVLVHEHYEHNRRLVGLEGQLLRMATKCKVKRESWPSAEPRSAGSRSLTPSWSIS